MIRHILGEMFLRRVFRRIMVAVLMYLALILTFSAVFNSLSDQTLRSRVEEETAGQMTRVTGLSGTDYQKLLDSTRQDKLRQYHLEDPLVLRIFWHAFATLSFDFGHATSMKSSQGDPSVLAILLEALPDTLILFGSEALLVTGIGLLAGLWAAGRPGSLLDRATTALPPVLNGLPSWWVLMMLLMLFAYAVPIFPSGGSHGVPSPGFPQSILDYLWHLALPLLALVLLNLWNTALLVRQVARGILGQSYIKAARSRGLPESRILFVHTLRASAPAVLTIAIVQLLQSLGGNILVEGIFNRPGLGSLYFVAVQQNDTPVLMAVLALQTLVNLAGFIFLDLSYGLLDPRIRVDGKP